MNFGAFAGGFSQGLDNGMRIGKSIRDMLKEKKLDDLRQQGMAEAEQARAQSINDMIKEQGVQASQAPTSGPIDNAPPKAEGDSAAKAQAVSESSPTANPDAAAAKTAASYMRPGSGLAVAEAADAFQNGAVNPAAPTANPDPAGAATAASSMPSVSNPGSMAPVQSTPAQAVQAQPDPAQAPKAVAPTPQAVAGQGVAATTGPGFWVNGQRYDTREQARAAAERAAPSTMDMFMKNAAPKIAEQYMANGDPATAKAWMDYSESQAGKRAIKDWAAAYSAPDFDTAVARFGKYYTDHINDGVDYAGHSMKINADGTQVAVVKLKDKASGKTTEMELTRDKMIALGGANNPQKLFEIEQAKQQQADKLKFDAQLKAQERSEKFQDDVRLKGYEATLKDKGEQRKQDRLDKREQFQQDRMDQRERIKSEMNIKETSAKAQAEMDTRIDALIGAGYGEDDIKKMMPAIAGVTDHKRTTDPTERRAIITSELLKSNPGFARKSQDEQSKMVDDMMGVIYGPSDGKSADAGKLAAAASQAQQPSIAAQTMAYDPKLPVKWRKDTGQPYHLINGQYVPITGSVPLPAGGLPVK